jgi:hypothetical protein
MFAMATSRNLRVSLFALLTGLLGIGISAPAHALFFTVDFSGDGFLQLDGSDDMPFSFTGTTGTGTPTGVVSGKIRAVDLNILPSDIAFQTGVSGFTNVDVLVFDVVLNANSAIVDQIGVAVGTSPAGLDPISAGYLVGPGETTSPASGAGATTFVSGGGFFPGQYRFNFDLNLLAAGNLQAGETSRRLFVTWTDTGPNTPLWKLQTATFMISSGTDTDFMVTIVPEPGTLMLVGGGLMVLALRRGGR